MAHIVNLKKRRPATPENLITSRPWEFRRSDWGSVHFVQMLRSQSARLEEHRRARFEERKDEAVGQVPPCFTLKGGVGYTVHSIFLHRDHEPMMRDIYYLAGLVDCMINQVSPILRTSGIRDLYNKITTLQTLLSVKWQGPLDQVLCPIDNHLFSPVEYRRTIGDAGTVTRLCESIREATDTMFDILSHEYVFYTPGMIHDQ
ncbi:MAG: hypothetical protein JRJ03_10715 [Deltaproteobacteria bacterium]|nr:hypothetical protein [Deltaproteobacteria bacterium]MBW2065390.1 hypothetical protein [Deltaproteobacteria bacterium]